MSSDLTIHISMRLFFNRFSILLSTSVFCFTPLAGGAETRLRQGDAEVGATSQLLKRERKPQLLAQTKVDAEKQRSLEEAERLSQQAVELYQQGRFSEAIPIAQQALKISEKALGPQHSDVANNLNNLAVLYQSQGLYNKVEPLLQRSLKIWETVLGSQHPDVATSLNNLANVYQSQGLYSKAEPLYQRSLKIRETALGPQHPDVANSLNNLAGLYRSQGLYNKAEPLYQRSLKIRETVLGPQHSDVAQSLNNLAVLYQSQGLYSKAEPLYQRSLKIRETVLGPQHPDVATDLNNLANLYQSQGLYSKAKPLYQRSLKIRETALGPQHPDVANSLNNLANLYQSQGLYNKAEPLYQRSLKIRETTLGPQHPNVAQILNNLAELYHPQGLYSKAEPLYQQSLKISEKALGPQHPNVAQILNNLAELYSSQGLYSKAEPLHQRSLKIKKQVLGSQHPNVTTSLNNLAVLYQSQGLYSKAEPLHQQSLKIRETVLGPQHPDVAHSLNNLAELYSSQGLYNKAEPLYQRSLKISDRALGPQHPDVALSLNNLAVLHQSQNNSRAGSLFTRAAEIEEHNLDLILSTSSESRKRAYITTLRGTTYVLLSTSLHDASSSRPAAQLALTTVLRRKGRVLASLTDSFQVLQQKLAPEDRPLLDQLKAIRSKQATLTFQGSGQLSPQAYRATLTQLQTQEDNLENQLAQKSAEFEAEAQPVTIATVQQNIPQGAVLVELVKYRPYDLKAIKPSLRWGEPHYAAYLLNSNGDLQWVNLGAATPIDKTVTQFRQALKSEASNIKTTARQLDQQLMQPIRAKLGNTKQLLLSPDSQLNLIPFAALVDENNQYLVENYDITYLSSGRDLLKLQPTAQKNKKLQAPVIIANPDYDASGGTAKIAQVQKQEQNRSSRDLNLNFGTLPGTQAEATQLQKLLGVKPLTQTQATETALKQVQSPGILHIATHGFFLETDLEAAPPSADNRASITAVSKQRPTQKQRNYENPLLRSGLALAGANRRKSGTEDGIFTALEATNLNLSGTKLVVLSACETGLGNVENGEGVYGLRRAFVMAGAESQVLSLWKVDDTGTKDLMVKYYQRLLNKEGRGQALRQTQLEMLKNPQHQHPYYWAAFIPSGDWRPIR